MRLVALNHDTAGCVYSAGNSIQSFLNGQTDVPAEPGTLYYIGRIHQIPMNAIKTDLFLIILLKIFYKIIIIHKSLFIKKTDNFFLIK